MWIISWLAYLCYGCEMEMTRPGLESWPPWIFIVRCSFKSILKQNGYCQSNKYLNLMITWKWNCFIQNKLSTPSTKENFWLNDAAVGELSCVLRQESQQCRLLRIRDQRQASPAHEMNNRLWSESSRPVYSKLTKFRPENILGCRLFTFCLIHAAVSDHACAFLRLTK